MSNPRPISAATLSFGLVSVPVELYPTYESGATIAFNMINPGTGARVKQEYVDAKSGEKVERAELVKGYEFAKGQYVTFTKDEMAALEAETTESIDIIEFVPADKVDRLYLERAYYLGVGKGGDQAYGLLAEALTKTNLAGIGQYNARGKSYLVMLRPIGGCLLLETLHHAAEVRSINDVPVPDGKIDPRELDLAVQLLEQRATAEFKPEKYKDEVQERIRQQIDRKIAGQEIIAEPTQEPQGQVLDLMEALKQSLVKGANAPVDASHRDSPRKPPRRKER